MKILRSEAVDKSWGYFLMLNSILMVLGPPERLHKLKNRFFEKSEKYENDDDDDDGQNRPIATGTL